MMGLAKKNTAAVKRQNYLPETYTGTGCIEGAAEVIKEKFPEAGIVILADKAVSELHGRKLRRSLEASGIRAIECIIDCAAHGKTLSALEPVLSDMYKQGAHPGDIILGFGGGSICDLAGFAATCYMGGLPYALMPTTVTACVSSTVGGAPMLDLPECSNALCLQKSPSVVFCDTDTFETLDTAQKKNDAAELIRYGMIASPSLLNVLSHGYKPQLEEIVQDCMKIRASFFAAAEDTPGTLRTLQFGDTVAKALYRLGGGKVSPGEALAVGMCVITKASVAAGFCPEECGEKLNAALCANLLPTGTTLTADRLCELTVTDADRENGAKLLILPTETGRCSAYPMPLAHLRDFIAAGLSK